MAPPRNRRPGFSRRIQIGLFLGYVVAVIGIVLSLGLIMMSRVDPQTFSALRGFSIDAGAPLSRVGRTILGFLDETEENLKAYSFAGSQNEALRRELATARRKLIAAQGLERENARLRRMLALVDKSGEVIVSTRIVGSGLVAPRRFATLAAGSRNGVAPGQPVRTIDGLVGRVLETGQSAARVLLLTDPDSSIPVQLTRNGTPAIARGRGDTMVSITSLLPGAHPFRRGDLLVTSGTGGIYPPGIPVALIIKVDNDTALGWPLSHPETLDFAMVMRPYLAPPAPAEAPQP